MTEPTERRRLSPREGEILAYIMDAKRNREIGEALGITERTVKNHVSSIYAKMRVQSRAELMKLVNRRTGSGWSPTEGMK